ncbi:MAG TPA: TrwC relaxase [Micromonosporaceae bacterium]|nr:TrwC relaxase [Micromonosporaceae bacterium]
MLSIATGYDPRYLTGQVAKGVENYYTKAVKANGEPPGVWQGGGSAPLGLLGQVDERDMEALYVHFVDPRSPEFRGDRRGWARAPKLGRPPRKYATAEQLLAEAKAREPDAEPERLEHLLRQSERRARRPVAFLDVTFGVPKSFSILHTALRAQEEQARTDGRLRAAHEWARKAGQLESAIWAGNNAALDYLQKHAGFSRAGYHGARTPAGGSVGRWVDGHDFIVASFFQHTNRGEDMHLHIHNAILNRVLCADGKWRTLDSRAIHRMRGAAGAVAERVMTEQAIALLGVQARWSLDGHTLELVGVSPQARALFSSRRREVTAAANVLIAQFTQNRGRPPNALEVSRLALVASKGTRPGKRAGREAWPQRLQRWESELRQAVDQTLAQIAHTVIGRVSGPVQIPFSRTEVITAAVAQVQEVKSSWTRYDLIRALNEQLPWCLDRPGAAQTVALLEELADEAIAAYGPAGVVCLAAPDLVAVPDELRLSDGRSVFEAPAELAFATRGQLAAEEALARSVRVRAQQAAIGVAVVDAAISQLAATGTELGADQAAAVRGLLTGRDHVSVLVGPAGTGKSFVMGMVCGLWRQHTGRRVIGLATAQLAALVLENEGFSSVDNIDRWLQRQARLDMQEATVEDQAARLSPGDLVVVDEAGMTPTSQLAAIQARCAAAGARLIVVGDERQLSAVGAGGAFRLMAQHAPVVHTLDEVRRFAARWERPASLRLRDGDTNVISDYERYGRIVDGGTSEQAAAAAARAWLADTVAGRHSLLVVGTGEEAADLSARLRARLVELGRVAAEGVPLGHESAQGTLAGAGDIVQTRRNDWRLRDPAGRAVINRDMWQVTAVLPGGGLRAQRITGHRFGRRELGPPVNLPPAYVAEHVTLGYALTVHSAQGSTVDTCYSVVTARTAAPALYVAMTRGRRRSVAYVVTAAIPDGAPVKPEHVKGRQPGETRQTPGQILMAIMDRAQPDLPATELRDELLLASGSMPVLGSRWAEALALAGQQRFHAILRDINSDGLLPDMHYARLLADEAVGTLWRLIRLAELAGHHPERLLRTAIGQRQLGTAQSVAEVLHYRITGRLTGERAGSGGSRPPDALIPAGDTWEARTPHDRSVYDPIGEYALDVARAMDARCAQLGEELAVSTPGWAAEWLGPVPADTAGQNDWSRRAGVIAGYRETFQAGDDFDPVGPCPKPGRPEARAAWFAAWRALGAPQTLAAESTMDVATLVAVVQAYQREREWAPEWVGGFLRHDIETARTLEQDAHLLRAQATTEPDPRTRAAMLAAADEGLHTVAAHRTSARDLAVVDEARAAWHTHTDPKRQAAGRAVAELRRRRLDPAGQRPALGNSGKGNPETKTMRKLKKNREAVSYTGDISQALAQARAAHQRIAAERTAEQANRAREPGPVAEHIS